MQISGLETTGKWSCFLKDYAEFIYSRKDRKIVIPASKIFDQSEQKNGEAEFAFFDRYVVLGPKGRVVFSSMPFANLGRLDSLIVDNNDFDLSVGTILEGDIEYRAYNVAFELTGTKFTLFGLKNSSDLAYGQRQIRPGVVMVFLALVVLLILLIPHLKIYNLGINERLSHKDIFNISASLFLMVAFTSSLMISYYDYQRLKSKSIRQLEWDIKKYKTQQSVFIQSFLLTLDTDVLTGSLEEKFKERFMLNDSGRIVKNPLGLKRYTSELTGNDLSYRDYFNKALDNDSAFQIVKSVSSDVEYEFVIARKKEIEKKEIEKKEIEKKEIEKKENYVDVITFKMDLKSLKDSLFAGQNILLIHGGRNNNL